MTISTHSWFRSGTYMLSCHIRLTRPLGQTESFSLGEEWEEGSRLAPEAGEDFGRYCGSPGGGGWSNKSRGPLFRSSEQMGSSALCVLHSMGVLSLSKLLRSLRLMDGKVTVSNSLIFYFNWAMEGALLDFIYHPVAF